MTEAARQLLEQVRRDFLAEAEADPALRALREKIDAGEGSYADAEDYAYQLGELLSGKLREALGVQSDVLFQEAAAEVLRGALAEDHDLVSAAAASVQEALNRQAGLGLKAETVPLDQDRVEGLAQRVQEAGSYDKAEWLLKEPVKNFSQNVVDDTLKRNVEAQGKAGLRPRIIRKASGGCCPWCAALAGKYDYPDVPKDVYHRHLRCRCTTEYDPGYGKRRQDVWTKSWTSPEEDAIMEERKTYGLEKKRPVHKEPELSQEPQEKDYFVKSFAENPSELGEYTPASLKETLEEHGYTVTPMTNGRLKGIPFEEGGGYKVNFSDSGLLMYHPDKLSHHNGAYYKISTGKRGTHHYDLNGKEFNPKTKL